jgi:hypothetical protein
VLDPVVCIVTVKGHSWVDGRVDAVLAALGEFGMSMSRVAAAELIDERVHWVATQMRVTPAAARRYLTDEAIAGLAESIAVSAAHETPGADVIAAPRTCQVPVALLGRCVAALAEAIQVRLAERDDVDHLRTMVQQLAQALSAVGQVVADQPGEIGDTDLVVMLPPGPLHRAARYLEAAAALADDGFIPPAFDPTEADSLADAFRQDAASLRTLASLGEL